MASADDFLRQFKASDKETRQVLLEDLKTKLTRARGAQTRAITASVKWIEKSATASPEMAVQELRECTTKIKDTVRHLQYLTLCYTSLNFKDSDSYEDDFVAREGQSDSALIDIADAIQIAQSRVSRKPPPPPASPVRGAAMAAAATAARARPVTDLKPAQLEYGSSPSTFKSWTKDLQHYFNASKFELEPTNVQQGYLFACLSDSVRTELEARITEETPIFGEEGTSSCLNSLRELWLQRHPVFVRRARLFTARQQAGESATQLVDRMMEMAKDAEVESMTLEDWVTQFSMLNITDKRISTKWMEASEPDVKKLRELALSVDSARAKASKGAQAEEAPGSARVFATSGQSHTSRGAAGSSSKKDSSKAKGGPNPCYNCGSTKHSRKEECPVFKKGVKCDKCKKPGHLQRVCRQNASSSKRGSAQQQK